MCGVVGYSGQREAEPILLEGLRRLEYRGYDSAGLATLQGSSLHVEKCAGRVADLAARVVENSSHATCGIAHTRWATHGGATNANAHPHTGGQGTVAVVHNGVIENFTQLKEELRGKGVRFASETDSEVIAHLIAQELNGDLAGAVRKVLPRLKGSYGLAVVSPLFPGLIVGARLGSPLVVGLGENETFLASDTSALAGYARRVIHLRDREMCVINGAKWEVHNGKPNVPVKIEQLNTQAAETEKGVYDHFMLKEIYEQPAVIERALAERLDEAECTAKFPTLNIDPHQLSQADRIIMTACGTSYHAALIGEYLFESLARMPVEVEYASEFRYRNPPIDRRTIVLALSQSGETADTLAAMREAKRKGLSTLALYNVAGSSIAREADGGVDLQAGPEIGVASTKAFTAQVTVLALLALYFGRMRHMSAGAGARILEQLKAMPDRVRQALECHQKVIDIARKYQHVSNFLYLGRQYLFPVALEGALKLKEISYIHAEGYPAAEMKHGPIALVDPDTPSVFLAPRSAVYEKVMSNLEEVRARGGPVIAVAEKGDEEIRKRADEVIYVPKVEEHFQPLVAAVPLQLLAYHIALLRGCDIDKPRNLAKSVTVE